MKEEDVKRLYSISAFAKLTGVTERTLRYYDRQQLLSPSHRNEHGHRYYSEQDLLELQRILTLKFLGFSLEEIGQHLSEEHTDLQASLQQQHQLLLKKRQQLNRVIDNIERMQRVSSGMEQIDRNLLLTLLYNLQHEDSQRAWFTENISQDVASIVFLDHWEDERRLEFEQQTTTVLIQLIEFFKQGKQPDDEEVLVIARSAIPNLIDIVNEVYGKLSDAEQVTFFDDLSDPMLFPSIFSDEEELFIQQVLEQITNEFPLKIKGEDASE